MLFIFSFLGFGKEENIFTDKKCQAWVINPGDGPTYKKCGKDVIKDNGRLVCSADERHNINEDGPPPK